MHTLDLDSTECHLQFLVLFCISVLFSLFLFVSDTTFEPRRANASDVELLSICVHNTPQLLFAYVISVMLIIITVVCMLCLNARFSKSRLRVDPRLKMPLL